MHFVGLFLSSTLKMHGPKNKIDMAKLIVAFRSFANAHKRTEKKRYFLAPPEFFLAGMKVKCDEGGGRLLLGDNNGGGAVMRRPIRFHCVGLWVSAGLACVHTYMYICLFNSDFRKTRLAQDLPERNYCASWRVSVDYTQCPVLVICFSKKKTHSMNSCWTKFILYAINGDMGTRLWN